MGMFDWYRPRESLHCPVCGGVLTQWQGHAGTPSLFVWAEGTRSPVDQLVDDEIRVTPWPDPNWELPDNFLIRSHDCGCPHGVEAVGHVVKGVWVKTTLVTIDNALQAKGETSSQWAARKQWLSGKQRA